MATKPPTNYNQRQLIELGTAHVDMEKQSISTAARNHEFQNFTRHISEMSFHVIPPKDVKTTQMNTINININQSHHIPQKRASKLTSSDTWPTI